VKIRVRCFAAAREAVGRGELEVELPDGSRAADLFARLEEEFPRLKGLASSLVLSINQEYSSLQRLLAEGDEVALIPPVSGGQDFYRVTDQPLSLDSLARVVSRNTSGAIAAFLGIVREFSRGRRVLYLEYEAYKEMAEVTLKKIGEEVKKRWTVDALAIVHRVGRLEIGEASVAIIVSAPHRKEALEACAYAIERLKADAPIWKKEVWGGGEEWIAGS